VWGVLNLEEEQKTEVNRGLEVKNHHMGGNKIRLMRADRGKSTPKTALRRKSEKRVPGATRWKDSGRGEGDPRDTGLIKTPNSVYP